MTQIRPRAEMPAPEREKLNEIEKQEWLDSLAFVMADAGDDRAAQLLEDLDYYAYFHGAPIQFKQNTPYLNTIDADKQPVYPGDIALELKIRNIIRWNAVAMVVKANKNSEGIGGHLSATPAPPNSSKSATTTSSGATAQARTATCCFIRATPRRASTAAAFWKGVLTRAASTAFGANSARTAPVWRATRTPG